MAVPTYVAGSAVGSVSSGVTTRTASVPIGYAQNDLWVVFLYRGTQASNSETVNAPSGFTLRESQNVDSVNPGMIWAYTKPMGASESDGVFSWTTSANAAIVNFAVRGASLTTPVHAQSKRQVPAPGSSWAAPAVTTLVAECLLACGFGTNNNTGGGQSGTLTYILGVSGASRGIETAWGVQSPSPGTTNPEQDITSVNSVEIGAITLAIPPPDTSPPMAPLAPTITVIAE